MNLALEKMKRVTTGCKSRDEIRGEVGKSDVGKGMGFTLVYKDPCQGHRGLKILFPFPT